MRWTLPTGVTALLLAVALCSADAAVIQIKMTNGAYAPAQASAHVGDTVEWTNDDIVAHTATARNGAWDLMVQPKGKASITLKSPGTIEYLLQAWLDNGFSIDQTRTRKAVWLSRANCNSRDAA